ncbi:polyprenyl synthetase family protein [Streptomyces sp. NPDC001594]|uniref:polyprenyl synthetase family protein n=1 Tax=Streptomyces sp. NPDC001594 TaxID=3364590 RepID=UPI003685FAE3
MTVVSSAGTVRPAQQLLRDAAELTRPALRAAVEGLPVGIRHPVGLHFGWWDQKGSPLDGGRAGKAVRPALVFSACEAVGGTPEAGVAAAVAVELVHNASLLHDDIIDGDRLRRGRPAVWAALGVPAAILAGDALFFLAVQTLAEAPGPLGAAGPGMLTRAVQELIDGEYTDTLLEDREAASVSVAEVTAMARGKTGELIAASCALGAVAGGADGQRVRCLRAFGEHVGAAFQLIDDVLGLWGDPVRTGKPAGADLAARKKSLPIAAALASGSAAGRELRRLYAGGGPLAPAEAVRAAALVEEAGGRSWAVHAAERHTRQALEELAAARPRRTAAAELRALADLVTSRDH